MTPQFADPANNAPTDFNRTARFNNTPTRPWTLRTVMGRYAFDALAVNLLNIVKMCPTVINADYQTRWPTHSLNARVLNASAWAVGINLRRSAKSMLA